MTIKPFPAPPRWRTWPALNLNIEGVTNPGIVGVNADIQLRHARPYLSPTDPPPEWYKTFSSAQYMIEQVPAYPLMGTNRYQFRLTPVVNRPVYTFDVMGDFVEAARDFTVRLFTSNFINDVAQYRVRRGPPIAHVIYRLPPDWTWKEP